MLMFMLVSVSVSKIFEPISIFKNLIQFSLFKSVLVNERRIGDILEH